MAGSVEHTDRIIDAPVITIGRATDQVLHLQDRRARLQHATIEQQNDGVHITTTALSGVSVNGRSQRDSKLSTGDVIEVGANILRVIDAPDGVDFAITFELSAEASQEHFVTSWSEPVAGIAGWSKRRLSWALVIAVAILAFVLPRFAAEELFLAGPVHSAHSSTASECENCHINAFQRVPDSACMECHTVDRHVALSIRSGNADHGVGGDQRRHSIRCRRGVAEIAAEGRPALNLCRSDQLGGLDIPVYVYVTYQPDKQAREPGA